MEYWINDVYYDEKINNNISIFQKCSEKGVDIPCFCYHENLSIAGNCRMCLVQINTSLKLIASCALPLSNGIKIDTISYRVKKARESVIEFLLVNHPLDCPVCDQGGECDLQDITMVFGSDKSRFYEYNKRAVLDVEVGSFIKTVMTRCIHCTRCIRFFTEISGVSDLGMLGRGVNSEVSTYVLKFLDDELSGNVIDLCPVGALTSKPYAFKARVWELNSLESIDIFDSLGSNIRIDFLNNEIIRILPIYNKNLNEDWITNKIRFFYDSLNVQRIITPLIKIEVNLIKVNWEVFLGYLFFNLLKYGLFFEIYVFFFSFCDINSIDTYKKFFTQLGGEIFFYKKIFHSDFTDLFFFNILDNFDEYSDIIFVGLNLRMELPILNSKLRKNFLSGNIIKFYGVGLVNSYSTYFINFLGIGLFNFIDIIKGRNIFNIDFIKNLYINLNFFFFNNSGKIKVFFSTFFLKFNNSVSLFIDYYLKNIDINFIISSINYLTFLELVNNYKNFSTLKGKSLIIFDQCFENREILYNKNKLLFLIYRGVFFNEFVANVNMVLPIKNFVEDSLEFFNIEGKYKKTTKILNTIFPIWSNEHIFTYLNILKKQLFFNNFSYILNFNIFSFFCFLNLDFTCSIFTKLKLSVSIRLNFYTNLYLKNFLFNTNVLNFYKSNQFLQNSKIMQLASLSFLKRLVNFYNF